MPAPLRLLRVAPVALLAAFSPCFANPPAHVAVELDYRVDPGIAGYPDEQALRAAIPAQLGYDPTGKAIWGDEITAHHDDCGKLVTSMAISIHIGIDPLALAKGPPPASSTPPEPLPRVPVDRRHLVQRCGLLERKLHWEEPQTKRSLPPGRNPLAEPLRRESTSYQSSSGPTPTKIVPLNVTSMTAPRPTPAPANGGSTNAPNPVP